MPGLNIDNKWIILLLFAALVVFAFLMLQYVTPDAAAILKAGRAEFDSGRYAQARVKFAEVLAMTEAEKGSGPRCEARVFYATTFVRENRFAEAAREFRVFIAEYPNSFWTPQAYFDLAYCESVPGNRRAAYNTYRDIIRKFPTTAWAKYSKERLPEFKDVAK